MRVLAISGRRDGPTDRYPVEQVDEHLSTGSAMEEAALPARAAIPANTQITVTDLIPTSESFRQLPAVGISHT